MPRISTWSCSARPTATCGSSSNCSAFGSAPEETHLTIAGEDKAVALAAEAIEQMQRHLAGHGLLRATDVEAIVRPLELGASESAFSQDGIGVFSRHKVVKPSTEGQRRYIQTLLDNDITFCTGPAGTGKTYLAVAVAVSMLRAKQIRRIILARPAVEAGERLGFLPGDLAAKVNPYLRPLFDALEDMMDFAQMRKFLDLDVIEIIPLAFMRGRTLNESVVICDEAQNTSAPADADGPDPPGPRLQDDHHRRHHPDRPGRHGKERPGGGHRDPQGD